MVSKTSPVAGMIMACLVSVSVTSASPVGVRGDQPVIDPAWASTPDMLLAQRVLDDDEKKPDPVSGDDDPGSRSPKNPWIAMGLSALLPGAGQWYAEPGSVYSFLFLGVEATAWFLNRSWESDGDEKTAEFERYAWTGDVHPSDGAPYNELLRDEGNWSWTRWRESFGQPDGCLQPTNINYLETDSTLVSFWFTNRREFFEDIGKYDKYDCGWTSPGAREIYVDMRDETNRILERARQMTQVVLLNHIASAVHAYFAARSHNLRLEEPSSDVRMSFHSDPTGSLGAQLLYTRRF